MTTDDDMREIEDAIHDYAGMAIHIGTQYLPGLDKLLALIRQKLPQTDAEHERAVEAWRESAASCWIGSSYAIDEEQFDEALRLMRARPVAGKEAGELLRAAIAWRKIPQTGREQEERETDLLRAIEAFERAGVR